MVQIPKSSIPQIYAAFMEEVKLRTEHGREWLRTANQHRAEPEAFLYVEFAYLQVRRITELLALAVLTAHNQAEEFRTQDFIKEWNADALFAKLVKMNESGFPTAIDVILQSTSSPGSTGSAEIVLKRDGHLNPAELRSIYRSCSQRLHAGSLKGLIRQGGRHHYDLGAIENWFNQIVGLLSHHVVRLPEMKATILVAMAQEPDGNVHCAMSEMVGEGPQHFVP